jgi:tetratricopeptide (TPR) repeat protein
MRRLLLLVALSCPATSFAAPQDFMKEFQQARGLEMSDPQAATEGMIASHRDALAAGNADYARAAAISACLLFQRQGKSVQGGEFARTAITGLLPFPVREDPDRAQLFGFMERGLLAEGKLGAAWQANRAAAETLRGKNLPAAGDGPSITVREVTAMDPVRRSLGWRLIERESEMLDLAGRTLKARELLDRAANALGDRWPQTTDSIEQFYAFKLLASRAMLMDFIGEDRDALRAQEQLFATQVAQPDLVRSYQVLHLNLLRNRSQWEGPSDAILQEAREVVASIRKGGGDLTGVERLLAKMELDLHDSPEALDALAADVRKTRELGRAMESVYAQRDSLAARAKRGDEGLESEYASLLASVRSQGNKRGEPTLYNAYGSYLVARKRPAEAIPLFLEALRLTRSFGLDLHEPNILGDLFEAQFNAGDLSGARTTLAALEAFLKAHPGLPDFRRVPAEVSRAVALARLGDKEAARAALRLARTLATNLPEYQKRKLTPEFEAGLLDPAPAAAATVASAAAALPVLTVQPLEVASIAASADSAHTRFSVFNPTGQSIAGQFEIEGPGATADAAGTHVRFVAGKPAAMLHLARTLAAGNELSIAVALDPDAGATAAKVSVAWKNPGQPAGPVSTWSVSWDPSAKGSIVLDASSLVADPFHFVSLFHELSVPMDEIDGLPFRLRSPVPIRLEYYDASSQELLAIDANGDGDFNGSGDLHGQAADGTAAAIAPLPAHRKATTVEVHIFATDGLPLFPERNPVTLAAEVYRDGKWSGEAEDVLR